MAKVLCTIENASERISDVRFVKHKDGMISEEIDDEKAKFFLSCTGFHPVGEAGEQSRRKRGRPPKGTGSDAEAPPPVDSAPPADDSDADGGDDGPTGEELDGDGNPLF